MLRPPTVGAFFFRLLCCVQISSPCISDEDEQKKTVKRAESNFNNDFFVLLVYWTVDTHFCRNNCCEEEGCVPWIFFVDSIKVNVMRGRRKRLAALPFRHTCTTRIPQRKFELMDDEHSTHLVIESDPKKKAEKPHSCCLRFPIHLFGFRHINYEYRRRYRTLNIRHWDNKQRPSPRLRAELAVVGNKLRKMKIEKKKLSDPK